MGKGGGICADVCSGCVSVAVTGVSAALVSAQHPWKEICATKVQPVGVADDASSLCYGHCAALCGGMLWLSILDVLLVPG